MDEQDDLIELFNESSVKTLTTKHLHPSRSSRNNDRAMDVSPRYDLQAHMESQIFIGDNGEVTDYFLEVMKKDPSLAEAFNLSCTGTVPTDHTTVVSDIKLDDSLRYNSILANNREINQLLMREIDQLNSRNPVVDHNTCRIGSGTQLNNECISLNKTIAISNSKRLITDNNCPSVHSKKHFINVRSSVSHASPSSDGIDQDMHGQRHKPKSKLSKKQSKSVGKVDDPVSSKSPSYMSPKSLVSSYHDFESSPTAALDLDAETRIRSLELRLKGQLSTIKTLETQLHESRLLVDSKSKQLTILQTRLKTSTVGHELPVDDTAATAIGSTGVLLPPSLAVHGMVSTGTIGHPSSPMMALQSSLRRSEELTVQYKVLTFIIVTISVISEHLLSLSLNDCSHRWSSCSHSCPSNRTGGSAARRGPA